MARTRFASALAFATGFLLSAAGAYAQDVIKIGVITDRVGSGKFYAEPVTRGIELGAKMINEKGGVLGKKIQLIIEDDQNKPDVSAAKARKLVDDGVIVIMSNTGSPATQQAQTVSLETKTPHLTPANSADTLTTQLDNPWFFQTGPLASIQLATLMTYTKSRGFKKVAIVRDNSALSQSFAESFRKGLDGVGIETAVEEVIPQGTTSAVANLQKVRAAKVDAILQAGILGPEMLQFFRAYQQLGMKEPILGSYNLSIPAYLTMAKDLMEGVVFVDAYDETKPEAKAFRDIYVKEYKEEPSSLPAYGWDGIHLVAQAIEKAGSLDKEKVRAAIAATTGFSGAIGAKGSSWGFRNGGRSGFDPQGAVVRLIKNNQHGPVVHSGQK
ncbi:ABC transporter substrate-binding protein [Roseiarcaceae bacterium H3SJ34-1]|uniref:ABC transporter substrate-binding protein n=1 Tax=Terripilifer ovatus TaxID=3032367 RepID=UPI003AB92301|nr:ABC transporter substrate-binding protein [Roseiarcaceae bacterium H3SJ34-1]